MPSQKPKLCAECGDYNVRWLWAIIELKTKKVRRGYLLCDKCAEAIAGIRTK